MTVINAGSVSRRELRHALLRRRNERIAADRHAAGLPTVLRMHPDTWGALLIDGDRDEQLTINADATAFLGVSVLTDPEVVLWAVEVDWPASSSVPSETPEG